MSIQSVCKTKITLVVKNATLKDVSEVMHEHHVGCVVVTETLEGKRVPAGIITDRDVALAMASSPYPQMLKVEQIMKSHPATVKKNDGIFETIVKMREMGVRRLPVVNTDGTLYGIICSDDLLSLMAEEINNLAKITDIQIRNEKGVLMPKEVPLQL